MLKIHDQGRTIAGLHPESILRDAGSPEQVVQALDAWCDARGALREPAQALREAEKAAQETTLLVRGERPRWEAEIREKTQDEAKALRLAERDSKRAATALVEVLNEHAAALRAVGARLALEAHARKVDAALAVEEARRAFRTVVPGGLPAHRSVDPATEVLRAGTSVQVGPLEAVDKVNAHALADLAGTRLGLVEIASQCGARLLTTPRRADAAVQSTGGGPLGRRGWTFFEDEEGSK